MSLLIELTVVLACLPLNTWWKPVLQLLSLRLLLSPTLSIMPIVRQNKLCLIAPLPHRRNTLIVLPVLLHRRRVRQTSSPNLRTASRFYVAPLLNLTLTSEATLAQLLSLSLIRCLISDRSLLLLR